MTNEEAIHKLEYSKKAYQMLIDEKVDSGKFVGKDVEGEWKADTPLDEAYKSMIEALDLAIKALEQQFCEDYISRDAVDDYIVELLSGYLYDEERTRLEELSAYLWELPSVTPKAKWIPVKTRPMTEEEKEEIGNEYAFMYDCPLPDDGQDVLITDCFGNVEVDTFCRDYEGVYFETNCDDDEVIAWMPLPQPYKAESEDKE